jgi:hypothetical protein
MNVLVDDFVGNPEEFYTLVAEEVKWREIEGITFDWWEEVESTKMLRPGATARALRIAFRGNKWNVLAFQVGKAFLVSLRKTMETEADKAGFLHEVMVAAFIEIVRRSTRTALARYLEGKSARVPEGLDPAEVFF